MFGKKIIIPARNHRIKFNFLNLPCKYIVNKSFCVPLLRTGGTKMFSFDSELLENTFPRVPANSLLDYNSTHFLSILPMDLFIPLCLSYFKTRRKSYKMLNFNKMQ